MKKKINFIMKMKLSMKDIFFFCVVFFVRFNLMKMEGNHVILSRIVKHSLTSHHVIESGWNKSKMMEKKKTLKITFSLLFSIVKVKLDPKLRSHDSIKLSFLSPSVSLVCLMFRFSLSHLYYASFAITNKREKDES